MKRIWPLMLAITLSACAEETAMETADKAPEPPQAPITKSDDEWKQELTPAQYRILRQDGTEPPNGPVYQQFKKQGGGTYFCAGCDAELFSSNEKFDSHCGWPSFYDPSKAKNIKMSVDHHIGVPRTEVRCAICDGHLGHVFTGEGFDTPTDKRYCINGTVLKFVPFSEKKDPPKTAEKPPAEEPQKDKKP